MKSSKYIRNLKKYPELIEKILLETSCSIDSLESRELSEQGIGAFGFTLRFNLNLCRFLSVGLQFQAKKGGLSPFIVSNPL